MVRSEQLIYRIERLGYSCLTFGRNARSVIARRRFERLRTTTVKLQSSVRARRGQQQDERIEGAARLVQSRFRQLRKQRSAGRIRTKQYAKAAHIIQAHVRAYLTAQQDEAVQQQQRQRCENRDLSSDSLRFARLRHISRF